MRPKRYIILDDVPEDADFLKLQLSNFPFLELAQSTQSIAEALQVVSCQNIDLIFLDIDLDGENGLSLLTMLDNPPPVIITSSHAEYAAKSYEIGKTIDYIVKPFGYERLLKAISRVLSIEFAKNNLIRSEYIFMKEGRQVRRYEINKIDYIEAYGIYSKVYSQGQMHIVNDSLLMLSEALSDRMFQRVHKSFLVNMNKIDRFDRNFIWLDTVQIPVGNAYRPKLDKLIKLFGPDDTNV